MTEPYRIRDLDTWRQARDDYLAGSAAETVCRRYDLGLSCFRRRARKFGWRRRDQDDPAPAPDWDIYDGLDLREQADLARRRFFHALTEGRAIEARRWRELWNDLRRDDDNRTRELFPAMPFKQADAAIEDALADEYDEDDRFLDSLAMDDRVPSGARSEPEREPEGQAAEVRTSDTAAPAASGSLASGPVASNPAASTLVAENVHDVHSLFSSAHSRQPHPETPPEPPPDDPLAPGFRQRLLGGLTPAVTPFGTALFQTPGPLTPENLLQARLALGPVRSNPPDQPCFKNST